MGLLAAVAKACVSASAPSGLPSPISAQRPCLARSVRVRGRAASELQSAVLSRSRQANVPPSRGFSAPLVRLGAPSRPRCEVPRSPSAQAGARGPRRAVRPSGCAPCCSKLLCRPTWERRGRVRLRGTCQRPRPLSSRTHPRRLPGRRSRHTWGAWGSKLGGDVNRPGRTSPQTSAAGWAGWDGEKVTRTPQRRPNDIGEGGGDRGDAPSHSALSLCPRRQPRAFGAELGVAAAPGQSD